MLNVSGSISANTGIAFCARITSAFDITVIGVVITSSPVRTPTASNAACKVPVTVIYDAKNHPKAIHKEYAPWKSKYDKFIFGEKNINQKLIRNI